MMNMPLKEQLTQEVQDLQMEKLAVV